MFNWDDLKYFLAMADEGSLSAAARKLNVSQPTLSRRLTTLEEQVGSDLFARTRTGLEMTAIGEQLIDHARHMRDDVYSIERMITGHDSSLQGNVVISCIEILGADWLVRHTRPFREQFPGITVEFKIENAASDLLRREADIAVRMFRPVQNDLIAKRTGTMKYGYYASKKYIEKHGMPQNMKDLSGHEFILPHDEILAHTNKFNKRAFHPTGNIAFRSNNLISLASAVREGFGIGAYSCIMADKDPNLVRLFDDLVVFSSDIWLVSHAELRRSARIRAMYDFLSKLFTEHAAAFEGIQAAK